uniref:Uncharacterized protein n=1 Tax=Ascaris lumbricoides TaxID=6252 RepID=A0A0M3HKJ8_ASCLU
MGSYLHSCGWLRRRVEHDSRSVSIFSHTTADHNEVELYNCISSGNNFAAKNI